MPSEADLELWCFHCHAESEYPDLVAMARGIERMYRELRKLFRSGTVQYQKTVLREEAEARLYRSFTIDILPGLHPDRGLCAARALRMIDGSSRTPRFLS